MTCVLFAGIAAASPASAQNSITPAMLKDWVHYLSSDEMRGRRNGSPELKAAAEWIAEQFRSSGLREFEAMPGYIQEYSFTSRTGTVNERNVIGYVEGSDPLLKNQFIVISAHFDHMGIRKGSTPDSVMNGADDNAAGTATIIGIARKIKESGARPGRSLIFAAFSGEENGMRGSRHFVLNPPVDPASIYANMNFEMTGHSEELGKGKYYMTGCSTSNLDDLLKEFSGKAGFQLVDNIPVAEMLFNSSDNIAFSRMVVEEGITVGIPSGTFATTTMAPHVHNVTDEAKLFDFENMSALVNHFADAVVWLSNNKSEVKWMDAGRKRPE